MTRMATLTVLLLAMSGTHTLMWARQTGRTAKVVTNADVVAMVTAKLSDDVIVASIRQAGSDFDVSPAALIALKNAGVSERVIQAMQATGTAVTAKQGVQGAPVAGTVFTSPMILTTRFAAVDRSLWGKGDWFTVDDYLELSKFTCDGVSLSGNWKRTVYPGLDLAVKVIKSGLAEVKIRVSVLNPSNNHDKSVTVVMEVLDGTVPVRTATIGPLKVEEGHPPKTGQTTFTIPLDLLSRQPALTLRLTVMSRDI